MRIAILTLAAAMLPLAAQEIKLPANLDKLSAKASQSVDVTLDGSMLRLASRFLSNKDGDQAKVKRLLEGLEGIYVRSYEFEEDGGYNMADVEAVRAQLQSPGWSRIVGVRSKHSGDDVDVFLKTSNDKIGGLVVISAEPRELTIVNIVGTIDPDQLVELSGQFDIPKFTTGHRGWAKRESR